MKKKLKRYRLDKLHKDAFVATFKGYLNGEAVMNFFDIYHRVHSGDYKRFVLQLHTGGGHCDFSRTIYKLLRGISRKMPVVIINIGQVSSAGVTVFQAGDIRLAAPDAEFMVHRPRVTPAKGKALLTEDMDALKEGLTSETNADQRLVGAHKLKGNDKRLYEEGKDVFIYTNQARKMGLVNGYLTL